MFIDLLLWASHYTKNLYTSFHLIFPKTLSKTDDIFKM